jgi:hypothetical protein
VSEDAARAAFEAGIKAAESEGFIGLSEAVADQLFTEFMDAHTTPAVSATASTGDVVERARGRLQVAIDDVQHQHGSTWFNADTDHCISLDDLRTILAALSAPLEVPPGCPPYAQIYVGDNQYAIVDWEDWSLVSPYFWRLTTRNNYGCLYAQSWDSHKSKERKRIVMHRLIMPYAETVDHINGNGLDNRRANLRQVTAQQNAFNQKARIGTSVFKGVSFDKQSGMWRSGIRVDGKRISLGRFSNEADAAKAYDAAARKHFGEYARCNYAD